MKVGRRELVIENTKEDLIDYLKDNLVIEIDAIKTSFLDSEAIKISVQLKLENEVLTKDETYL